MLCGKLDRCLVNLVVRVIFMSECFIYNLVFWIECAYFLCMKWLLISLGGGGCLSWLCVALLLIDYVSWWCLGGPVECNS